MFDRRPSTTRVTEQDRAAARAISPGTLEQLDESAAAEAHLADQLLAVGDRDRALRRELEQALARRRGLTRALLRLIHDDGGGDGFGGRHLHPQHSVKREHVIDWLRTDPSGMWLPALAAWLLAGLLAGVGPEGLTLGLAGWGVVLGLRLVGVWRSDRAWGAAIGLALSLIVVLGADANLLRFGLVWGAVLVSGPILAGRLCHTPLDDLRHVLTGGLGYLFVAAMIILGSLAGDDGSTPKS